MSADLFEVERKTFKGFAWPFAGIVIITIILGGVSLLIFDNVDSWVKNNWNFVFVISVTIVGYSFGLFLKFIYNWLERYKPRNDDETSKLYRRSVRLDRESYIVLFVVFMIIIGSSIVFFKAADFVVDDLQSLSEVFSFHKMYEFECKAEINITEPLGHLKYDDCVEAKLEAGKATLIRAMVVSDAYKNLLIAIIISIRVGDIVFASFLTYLFLRLYRYKTRLSAFYLSRADAMAVGWEYKLSDISPELLPFIMDANFDFGKDQPSLAQPVVDILRSLLPRKSVDKVE